MSDSAAADDFLVVQDNVFQVSAGKQRRCLAQLLPGLA